MFENVVKEKSKEGPVAKLLCDFANSYPNRGDGANVKNRVFGPWIASPIYIAEIIELNPNGSPVLNHVDDWS